MFLHSTTFDDIFDIHATSSILLIKFETTDHLSYLLKIVSRLDFMRLIQFYTRIIELHNFVNRLFIAHIEPYSLLAFVSLWMDGWI